MTPAVLFIAMSPPTGTGNFCRHHRAQQFTVRCAEFNFTSVQDGDGGAVGSAELPQLQVRHQVAVQPVLLFHSQERVEPKKWLACSHRSKASLNSLLTSSKDSQPTKVMPLGVVKARIRSLPLAMS